MQHIAIMNLKQASIDRILSRHKTIESRWYKNKVAPFDRIQKGDQVFFKYSGKKVSAKADVEQVLQFENLNLEKIRDIAEKYGKQIDAKNSNYKEWWIGKRYCILIFLKNPVKIAQSFDINKAGYGIGSAWLCTEEIEKIIKPEVQ